MRSESTVVADGDQQLLPARGNVGWVARSGTDSFILAELQDHLSSLAFAPSSFSSLLI
jgi:hypothetical protein